VETALFSRLRSVLYTAARPKHSSLPNDRAPRGSQAGMARVLASGQRPPSIPLLRPFPLHSPQQGESRVTDRPQDGEGDKLWQQLSQRKVVQWGIAYAAGAWGLLQGIAYVRDTFGWPHQLQQTATVLLLIGLPIVLVLAWYHGDKGQQRVTRVEFAILILLFLLGGGLFWRYEHTSHPSSTTSTITAPPAAAAATTEAGPSIAVLPFENRSDEHQDAFFVDGIHDDILTQLSKISALKVISRTSVEQFRDTKLPIKSIAEQLGVKSILEGGVQRGGDRVRINVQLIDAATDAHLWAETYDRELTAENIFAIQTELAAAIADALKAALTPAEKARVNTIPTRNLEAWEAYQLGKQRMAKRTSEGLKEAERFFRRAIELDPKFALAYSGLADTFVLQHGYSGAPFLAALEQAQTAVDTALKLDPGLSEAWASSGLIANTQEQYDRAEKMFRRAIELNPNNALAFKFYGGALVQTLRVDEGVRSLERAASLDPMSAIVQVNLADALQGQDRFPEAASHYRRAIAIDPAMPAPYASLGAMVAYSLNRFADAVPLLAKAVELDPGDSNWWTVLACMYLDLGDQSRSFATIEHAARRLDDWLIQDWLAFIDMIRRDRAEMARHAERSLTLYARNPAALFVLRNADLQTGRYDNSIARYQKAYPELFVPGMAHLDTSNYGVAVDLALVLQRGGNTTRARILLDSAAQIIGSIPRLGSSGYGIADVQIHALRGDKPKALAALLEAEKAGWRGMAWRYYRDFDPTLASIRNEPEFKAVFADIERDMARQRAELAARAKDAPLSLGEAAQ
jgi:TolB-like protein/Tfp pilus assembly protein PilF